MELQTRNLSRTNAMLWILVLCLLSYTCHAQVSQKVAMTLKQHWDDNFEGVFSILLKEPIVGWEINITFNVPITKMQQWIGDWLTHDASNKNWVMVNAKGHGVQPGGTTLEIKMMGKFSGSVTPAASAIFTDLTHSHQIIPPLPKHIPGQKTKYNYCDVLMKSILFYEAQRSGKLPASNRIPWRGDSALNDKGENGEDLAGGWYDAGDHVKFGLPMASSTTVLTWSLIQWKDAYEACGQLNAMYDCIKWPLDYFIKAHVAPHELYVQVGSGGKDHGYWGRPEDMTMPRPAYKVTESKPGSDVVGQTAAAMAAGSIAFKLKDPAYSATLLKHARQLFEFADKFRGKYSDNIPDVSAFYKSGSLEDEIGWAGIWLYMATGETKYLDVAEKLHLPGAAWGFSWDDTQAANNALLYNITGKDIYKTDITGTYTYWMPGGKIPYTPKGLAYRLIWGSLRYAANMAMIALHAAEYGINPDVYRKWAMNQIHYALGDTGRSFVVGFGVNPPQRPHHRSSSCPLPPAPCGWDDQKQKGPSPQVLYGALVGGPDISDNYVDKREDYVKNEVADDYNAGFQAAVAGLQHLALVNELPKN